MTWKHSIGEGRQLAKLQRELGSLLGRKEENPFLKHHFDGTNYCAVRGCNRECYMGTVIDDVLVSGCATCPLYTWIQTLPNIYGTTAQQDARAQARQGLQAIVKRGEI